MKDLFAVVLVVGAVLALLGSCGDESSRVCDPGVVRECPCVGGGHGVQSCEDSGMRWAPCQCEESDGDADGDTDGDVDADGDADGDVDGDVDGDGDGDGDADGDADGDSDADGDGDGDGDSDADSDGDGDGDSDADGDGDGDGDGDVDGDADGDADGDCPECVGDPWCDSVGPRCECGCDDTTQMCVQNTHNGNWYCAYTCDPCDDEPCADPIHGCVVLMGIGICWPGYEDSPCEG